MSRLAEPPLLASPPASVSADELAPAYCLVAAPAAVAAAFAALGHLAERQPVDWTRAWLVVCWAAAGVLVGFRRRFDRVAPICLAAATVGAVGMLADAYDRSALARVVLGVLPAIGLTLLASLPDGRLLTRRRRLLAGAAYVVGAATGLLAPHDVSGPRLWPFVVLWVAALAVGVRLASVRYRTVRAFDRRRMQWIGWALAVEAELLLVIVVLRLMADWPPNAAVVALATTALFPASLVAGTHVGLVARVDRLVAHTVTLAGLTALVILAYVAVIVALGRGIRDDERSLLLLSIAATGFAALAYLPLRTRLTDVANQFVYGDRVAPDDALRTWGSRLTRAIPLDELLLQLVESLRKSMLLASAQIFTGSDGRYELAAAGPHRGAPTVSVGANERAIIASAGVRGGTWLDVWLPQVAGPSSTNTRIAPIARAGDLLGLIVVTRDADGDPFGEENDRVLTELARQVGLALHNVQLDSALQASLNDLQQANAELHESRLRIVSTADAERRKLERNLHDGAEQHLVAMAVKLRIAEELVHDDPTEAVKLIAELRDNLKDAVTELRALAHGIFPPLLMSGGLAEALPAAAARAALPTTVDTAGVGRHSPEIESTIYFCCLEAMQNAGKHAGVDAEVTVRVVEGDGLVAFEVTDDGIGFIPGLVETGGHGFINMTDRLGAVGGRLEVRSSPGAGTTIRGEIPLG